MILASQLGVIAMFSDVGKAIVIHSQIFIHGWYNLYHINPQNMGGLMWFIYKLHNGGLLTASPSHIYMAMADLKRPWAAGVLLICFS